MKNRKYYIGKLKDGSFKRELFTSAITPDATSHGEIYYAAIGPFRTKRGAKYMLANPMIKTVAEAEKLSIEG